MNRHRISTSRRVGDPSSRYGYQPELFEKDLDRHTKEVEALWVDSKGWMMGRKVTPDELRGLFLRLWEEFLDTK